METIVNNYNDITRLKFVEYLATTNCPKLQIGSGKSVIDGWFNTDIEPINNVYYLNLLDKFIFPDNSFDYVFSEHNIEHFDIRSAMHILLECQRVLKPGGILRISTPDLAKLIDFYLNDSDLHNDYCKFQTDNWLPLLKNCGVYNKAFVLNDFFRNWGHKTIFDFDSLSQLLSLTGFENIIRVELNSSEHAELKSIEKHDQHNFNVDFNRLETMTLEAQKIKGL